MSEIDEEAKAQLLAMQVAADQVQAALGMPVDLETKTAPITVEAQGVKRNKVDMSILFWRIMSSLLVLLAFGGMAVGGTMIIMQNVQLTEKNDTLRAQVSQSELLAAHYYDQLVDNKIKPTDTIAIIPALPGSWKIKAKDGTIITCERAGDYSTAHPTYECN